MKFPIPAIRPKYSKEDLQGFAPEKGVAALFGVPSQFLYLAEPDQQGPEGYKIHSFRHFYVPLQTGDKTPCGPDDQFEGIQDLLSGALYRNPPAFIVINSYPYFFSRGYGEALLYHLACSVAVQRVKTKDTKLDFTFLGTHDIDQSKWEDPRSKNVFAWGPVTPDFVNYMYVHASKFMLTYPHYTRILLLSVPDIFATLTRLGIDLDYPDFVFNVGPEAGKDLPKKPPRWTGRKHRKDQPKGSEIVSL